jgi:hypothetical protein
MQERDNRQREREEAEEASVVECDCSSWLGHRDRGVVVVGDVDDPCGLMMHVDITFRTLPLSFRPCRRSLTSLFIHFKDVFIM